MYFFTYTTQEIFRNNILPFFESFSSIIVSRRFFTRFVDNYLYFEKKNNAKCDSMPQLFDKVHTFFFLKKIIS